MVMQDIKLPLKMQIFFVGLILLLLAGCASVPVPEQQAEFVPTPSGFNAPSAQKGLVVIIRNRLAGGAGAWCGKIEVMFDGVAVAHLEKAQGVRLFASPGHHYLMAEQGEGTVCTVSHAVLPIVVLAGGHQVFSVGMQFGNPIFIEPQVGDVGH